MNIETMSRRMLITLPDIVRPRTKDRMYVWTGFVERDKEGIMQRILADKDCTCGGRGYIGRDRERKKMVPCRCICWTSVPIEFIILPKGRIKK